MATAEGISSEQLNEALRKMRSTPFVLPNKSWASEPAHGWEAGAALCRAVGINPESCPVESATLVAEAGQTVSLVVKFRPTFEQILAMFDHVELPPGGVLSELAGKR